MDTMQYEGMMIDNLFCHVLPKHVSNTFYFSITGNSEAHLDDLCAGDPNLKTRMDQILQETVYPLVRSAFSEEEGSDGDGPPIGSLCVYDSILVRYNGDVAKAAGRMGASQPLVSNSAVIYNLRLMNPCPSD